MARSLRSHLKVASAAKFIDRFFQHKQLVTGMRIVTDDTSRAKDNTVDIFPTLRFFLCNQTFHLTVTVDAELQRTFCKELVTVVLTMGVMTKTTTTDD